MVSGGCENDAGNHALIEQGAIDGFLYEKTKSQCRIFRADQHRERR